MGRSILHGRIMDENSDNGKKKMKTNSYSLPAELVEEILCRLPAKPLGRFMSVCKSWCYLISSKTFVNNHLNNYSPTSITFISIRGESFFTNYYFSLQQISSHSVVVDKVLNIPLEVLEVGGRDIPCFCGPCNGIICVYSYPFNRGILYNPATKDYKLIQESLPLGKDMTCTLEMGFDHITDDYKIIQIVYYPEFQPRLWNFNVGTKFRLYSLRSNYWRELIHTPNVIRPGRTSQHIQFCSLPFTRYRIISWLVTHTNRQFTHREWQICMFDVSSETFEIFNLDTQAFRPPQATTQCNKLPDLSIKLFPHMESLALFIWSFPRLGSPYDIWVLNHFCFSAQSRSWTRLLSLECEDYIERPLGYWGGHLLFFEFKGDKWKLFDLRTQEWMDLALYRDVVSGPVAYKESLVSISKI